MADGFVNEFLVDFIQTFDTMLYGTIVSHFYLYETIYELRVTSTLQFVIRNS